VPSAKVSKLLAAAGLAPVRAAEAKLKEAADRIKLLEALIEEQAEQIDRKARVTWKAPKAAKRVSGGSYMRLIVPDVHGSYSDPAAMGAFLGDLEKIGRDVRSVIYLGDFLDCGGFLAAHHTLGYVAEMAYSFADDIEVGNGILDAIKERVPNSTDDFIEGNHERRIEKWCVTMALGNAKDAEYLRRQHSAPSVLHLKKRGISFFEQGKFYDGLSIPATIRRGKCAFTHGEKSGRHATAATLSDFGCNVVHGHTHRADSASSSTVDHGEIVGWCPGALCRRQPLWNHTRPTKWTHGYGLQILMKNESFLHINVPIIDGRSFLEPLLSRIEGTRAK